MIREDGFSIHSAGDDFSFCAQRHAIAQYAAGNEIRQARCDFGLNCYLRARAWLEAFKHLIAREPLASMLQLS